METVQKICLVFTIIGGIVWGLIGFFDYNLITSIFKTSDAFPRVIYGIVGISALINISLLFKDIREENVR